MFVHHEHREMLGDLFKSIRLIGQDKSAGKDKTAKAEQILSYLENIHAQVRKYSKKRDLIFIDSGAGNCYLSFLVYYFYSYIEPRGIRIHCIDTNERLMEKNQNLARKLQFDQIEFHVCDIQDFIYNERPDLVYSLHACDSATDKTLFLGLRTEARNIFSVSCCQHTIKRRMKSKPYTALTRHRVFKEKLAYMMADSLRALLVEMQGYKVDIIEFVSSRSTDKNIMLRAQKGQTRNLEELKKDYLTLQNTFKIYPELEQYVRKSELVSGL